MQLDSHIHRGKHLLFQGKFRSRLGLRPGTNCPPDLGEVKAIAAGKDYSLALLKDGSVRGWGTTYGSYNPTNVPSDLAGVVAIAAGDRHGLALKADGTVRAWGWNNNSQCAVPDGLSNVVAVAGGEGHSLVLKKDGTVDVWRGKYYDGGSYVPMNMERA